MKKLEKLKLKELDKSLVVLNLEQANRLKGGDGDGSYENPYQLGEVVVSTYSDEPFSLYGPGSVIGSGNSCYNPDPYGYSSDPTNGTDTPTTVSPELCPRCETNREYGIVGDPIYGSENQRFWINTTREFFANTLPHILGVGGHVNGSE